MAKFGGASFADAEESHHARRTSIPLLIVPVILLAVASAALAGERGAAQYEAFLIMGDSRGSALFSVEEAAEEPPAA